MDQLDKYYDGINESFEEWRLVYLAQADALVNLDLRYVFEVGYRMGYFAGIDRGMELEHLPLPPTADEG